MANALRPAVLAALLAAGLATAPAAAPFRYASQNEILGLDPHAHAHGVTLGVKGNMYEALVTRVPDGSIAPQLATEWRLVNPTTWRFTLRQNVRFHNGEPFTADDVIASFSRIRQPGSDMAFTVSGITEIRKIDDHTIEIVTGAPNPLLLQDINLFFIASKSWIERNNATEVVRTAGASNFPNLNVNGTGPFRLVERVIDTRTVMAPNPTWWGRANHNITQASFVPIANPATRVAALLAGDLDMIYPVPQQDIPRVSQAAGVRVQQGVTARTVFLAFDVSRPESLDMPGSGRNPFRDVRVRQAFYHAIDIETIRRVVMRNSSQPAGLIIAPQIGGFQADLNTRLPFDADRARALLAEAGYASGFPVTLHCPNNRYINDEAICTAIIPMLTRVGIQARLVSRPMSQHINTAGSPNFEASFWMLGWTPGNFDVVSPIRELLTMTDGGGTFNWGRYSNPRLEALRPLIASETEDARRTALIREALTILRTDLPQIPLHQEPQVFGVRDTVAEFALRVQEDVDLRYVRMR